MIDQFVALGLLQSTSYGSTKPGVLLNVAAQDAGGELA